MKALKNSFSGRSRFIWQQAPNSSTRSNETNGALDFMLVSAEIRSKSAKQRSDLEAAMVDSDNIEFLHQAGEKRIEAGTNKLSKDGLAYFLEKLATEPGGTINQVEKEFLFYINGLDTSFKYDENKITNKEFSAVKESLDYNNEIAKDENLLSVTKSVLKGEKEITEIDKAMGQETRKQRDEARQAVSALDEEETDNNIEIEEAGDNTEDPIESKKTDGSTESSPGLVAMPSDIESSLKQSKLNQVIRYLPSVRKVMNQVIVESAGTDGKVDMEVAETKFVAQFIQKLQADLEQWGAKNRERYDEYLQKNKKNDTLEVFKDFTDLPKFTQKFLNALTDDNQALDINKALKAQIRMPNFDGADLYVNVAAQGINLNDTVNGFFSDVDRKTALSSIITDTAGGKGDYRTINENIPEDAAYLFDRAEEANRIGLGWKSQNRYLAYIEENGDISPEDWVEIDGKVSKTGMLVNRGINEFKSAIMAIVGIFGGAEWIDKVFESSGLSDRAIDLGRKAGKIKGEDTKKTEGTDQKEQPKKEPAVIAQEWQADDAPLDRLITLDEKYGSVLDPTVLGAVLATEVAGADKMGKITSSNKDIQQFNDIADKIEDPEMTDTLDWMGKSKNLFKEGEALDEKQLQSLYAIAHRSDVDVIIVDEKITFKSGDAEISFPEEDLEQMKMEDFVTKIEAKFPSSTDSSIETGETQLDKSVSVDYLNKKIDFNAHGDNEKKNIESFIDIVYDAASENGVDISEAVLDNLLKHLSDFTGSAPGGIPTIAYGDSSWTWITGKKNDEINDAIKSFFTEPAA